MERGKQKLNERALIQQFIQKKVKRETFNGYPKSVHGSRATIVQGSTTPIAGQKAFRNVGDTIEKTFPRAPIKQQLLILNTGELSLICLVINLVYNGEGCSQAGIQKSITGSPCLMVTIGNLNFHC